MSEIKQIKITLNLPEVRVDQIAYMANDSGRSKTQVINDAIILAFLCMKKEDLMMLPF